VGVRVTSKSLASSMNDLLWLANGALSPEIAPPLDIFREQLVGHLFVASTKLEVNSSSFGSCRIFRCSELLLCAKQEIFVILFH